MEKDKQKLIQEKCQTILAQMLRDEDNKYCVDCDAKGPRWASWNLGIFLCIRCAGIHRNLGVHISRVKSVNLDLWLPEQVTSLQQMGNSRARAVYEAYLPENFRRPQTDSPLESFIRAKYEHKKYIAKEWICPPPVKVSWDAEIELELKWKKEAKRKTSNNSNVIDLHNSAARSRPADSSPSASPSNSLKESPPVLKTPVPVEKPAPKISSAAQDLLGLDTTPSTSSASNDLFGGLLNLSTSTVQANESPAATNTNTDEDNFFNQKAPTATEKKTLDKNSIMALYNQAPTSQAPISNMFSTTPGNAYAASQPVFGQTVPSSMTTTPGMMGANFNPMMQGNMFSSQMFSLNGSPTASSMPQVTQLSQQMMGMNMGTTPTMYQPNPVVGPMGSNTQFIPGVTSNPSTMGNQAPAQVPTNPYMFLASGQTLSSNLWQ